MSAPPTVVVHRDPTVLANAVAARLVTGIVDAQAYGSAASIVVPGGGIGIASLRALRDSPARPAVDWRREDLWWGDERFVPIDHPQSNAGLAYALLLAVSEKAGLSGDGGQFDDVAAGDVPALPIDPGNVHPVEVEEALSDDQPVDLAAQVYLREMSRYMPLARGGVPVFDVILAGIGPDGHIFSLFPGSPGLALDAPIVLGVPAPEHVEPHIARVTLAARVLPVAHLVLVMSSGSEKAEILAKVMGDDRDVAHWPAQAALVPNAVWVLDRAAAAEVAA